MKKVILISLALFVSNAFAVDTTSKITIKNATNLTTYEVSGFYIQQLTTGNSCDVLSGNTHTPSHGTAHGVIWKPVKLAPNDTMELGANFLYQMMSQLLYQTYENSGPDCTPGSGQCAVGNIPDTNQWCIRLGVIKGSPMLPTGAVSSNNDLLSLGHSNQIKISCNDAKSTCRASTEVTQNIP